MKINGGIDVNIYMTIMQKGGNFLYDMEETFSLIKKTYIVQLILTTNLAMVYFHQNHHT